jgi:hypothetical protein
MTVLTLILVAHSYANRSADGRVDVKPLGADEIYIADVKVGTPPQTLKMALDTGSADL